MILFSMDRQGVRLEHSIDEYLFQSPQAQMSTHANEGSQYVRHCLLRVASIIEA